jgi:predicted DNA-binding transcriptional regulator YafY
MQRTERLFQLVLLLRGGNIKTAQWLAKELGVSERTIYRDVQALSLSGVPIEGEAGVGYRIRPGWDLPPLMFSREEAKALVLGVRMVSAWADPELQRAARRVLDKVRAVAPPEMANDLTDSTLFAPDFCISRKLSARLGELRHALEAKRKVHIEYVRADGAGSDRTVRPLSLTYWGGVWSLSGWCELRDDFREFRVDRMQTLTVVAETFEETPGQTLQDYIAKVQAEEWPPPEDAASIE